MNEQPQLATTTQPLGGAWPRERALLIAAVFLLYTLYYPATHYAITLPPLDMSVWLDHALPLSPLWILIYAMIYPATTAPLFVVREPMAFRRVAFAFMVSALIGLLCFLLFPVHMTLRPEYSSLPSEGFINWGVQLCYALDKPSGCFPSLHVTYATLAALVCAKANPPTGRVMWVVAILIDLSTMLVKQHFFADVLAGTALAYGSVWLSDAGLIAWLGRPEASGAQDERLKPLRYPAALFALIVGGLYLGYTLGIEPSAVAQ